MNRGDTVNERTAYGKYKPPATTAFDDWKAQPPVAKCGMQMYPTLLPRHADTAVASAAVATVPLNKVNIDKRVKGVEISRAAWKKSNIALIRGIWNHETTFQKRFWGHAFIFWFS